MIDETRPLLLGSASPRRREILATLGLPVRVLSAEIDESPKPGEGALGYLSRVVEHKLVAVASAARRAKAEGELTCLPGALLVADTTVVLDEKILGKPSDDAEARAMLCALAGREHSVYTRFAIAGPDEPERALAAETVGSRVFFRSLDDDEIDAYVATGEGLDKAGAYAIQGIGSFAVERIEGSYSNIVGLPACEVIRALRAVGLLARFPLPRQARQG